jgi:uncharacterized protein (TIGR00730 family)
MTPPHDRDDQRVDPPSPISIDPPRISLAVFCGSCRSVDPAINEAAASLGRELALRLWRMVYGAGSVGLMGIVADAALAAGGEVLGVIPDFLTAREVCHRGVTELIVTRTMHERKQIMEASADGFLILPGGFGTLDEFFEILTWRQLGLHAKPIGLWNIQGFYQPLLLHLDQMRASGFVSPENCELIRVAESLPDLLAMMAPAMAPGL